MNYGLINKPRKPGATQRVWELADALTEKSGRTARRKDVIDAYVAEGGNPNTASTQYHYWKVAQEAGPEPREALRTDPGPVRLRVEPDGRLTLPEALLQAMRLGEDRIVTVRVSDGELRAIAPKEAVRKIQGLLAPYKREGESVVDEFLDERRASWGEE